MPATRSWNARWCRSKVMTKAEVRTITWAAIAKATYPVASLPAPRWNTAVCPICHGANLTEERTSERRRVRRAPWWVTTRPRRRLPNVARWGEASWRAKVIVTGSTSVAKANRSRAITEPTSIPRSRTPNPTAAANAAHAATIARSNRAATILAGAPTRTGVSVRVTGPPTGRHAKR